MIVFSGDKVVTLVRPRKHSIHPSGRLSSSPSESKKKRNLVSDELVDLHLLLNTLSSPALRSSASASWLPICLPKFNPKGFLYCYVSFLDSISAKQDAQEDADGEPPKVEGQPRREIDDVGIGLAIVTPDREGFEKIRSVASDAETVSGLWLLISSFSAHLICAPCV